MLEMVRNRGIVTIVDCPKVVVFYLFIWSLMTVGCLSRSFRLL